MIIHCLSLSPRQSSRYQTVLRFYVPGDVVCLLEDAAVMAVEASHWALLSELSCCVMHSALAHRGLGEPIAAKVMTQADFIDLTARDGAKVIHWDA